MIGEWTIGELLARTASREPTPSAVSAAAVSAALGLGLVVMGLEFAAKRREEGKAAPDALGPTELAALTARGRDGMGALMRHAEDDRAAVQAFLAARALPRRTPEQKAARQEATRRALVQATEVPLDTGREITDALSLASAAVAIAPPPVRADAAGGAALLRGALEAVLGAVAGNLAALPAGPETDRLARARDTLALQVQQRPGR